jgi:hypothetical protein
LIDALLKAGSSIVPASLSELGSGDRPLDVLGRYLAFMAASNLVWEFAHLPLYTLWEIGSPWEIVFAALHCTGGDVLIALSTLLLALLIVQDWMWPRRSYWRIAFVASALGVGYTAFSEVLNTRILGSWAYSGLMPVIPVVEIGVSPLAQWSILPAVAFWSVRPRIPLDRAASAVVDAHRS